MTLIDTVRDMGFEDWLHLDFETFSECNLLASGSAKYARDPSTEILMCAYRFNTGDIDLWQVHNGRMHQDLLEALRNPRILKVAFNAPFEMDVISQTLLIPCLAESWLCTMILAHSCSFSGRMKDVAEQLELPIGKFDVGTRLINKFSVPQKPTKKFPGTRRNWETDPDDWETFCRYCIRDVEVESAIFCKLIPYGPTTKERKLWVLDRKINERGMPVDVDLVKAVLKTDERYRQDALEKTKEITDLDNPNSRDQILGWLRDRGLKIDALDRGSVAKALETAKGSFREVLLLRQGLSKSSVKKFYSLQQATCDDERLRGMFQFQGAGRTGRWAGRIVQPHNMPRGLSDDDEIETLVDLTKNDALDLVI